MKRRPICLVIPPSPFLLDERVFMPLGILRVAASLERAGYSCEMLDLSGISNYEEAVFHYVQRTEADVFALTSTTPQFPATVKISSTIRGVKPSSRIIIGGPHATLVNAAYRREKKLGIDGRATRLYRQLLGLFDVVVAGDGEYAIFVALSDNPPHLIDADDVRSELFLSKEQLDTLPFPARHLIDADSYKFVLDGRRCLSLIAGLGCPFSCGFCSGRTSPMLRKVRYRSSTSVLQEMRLLYEIYGTTAFMFYDDELNVSPGMQDLMAGIIDLQMALGVDFRLRGCIKSELFTDTQAKIMYDAGFRDLLVGFESGSDRILVSINKKATVEDNTRCLEIAERNGIKIKALMSIGHPGESIDTILETYDWLLEVQPHDFDVSLVTVLPGTFYYDHAIQNIEDRAVWTYACQKTGDRLHSYDIDFSTVMNYYKGDSRREYQSFVFTDFMKSQELVMARDWLEHSIRSELGIAYSQDKAAIYYDHSMGQLGPLPSYYPQVAELR